MELLCIIALLASNLWLIRRHFRKPDSTSTGHPPKNEQPEPDCAQAKEIYYPSIIGESRLDDDFINSIIEKRVKEEVDSQVSTKVKEEVERVIMEKTRHEDVEIEPDKDPVQVPLNKLDETFTHKTISEAEGEDPEVAAPMENGDDFKAIESAVRCAKDEPHTEEEAAAAKTTLAGLQGTQIEERISLNPAVRTRILTILFGDEDSSSTSENLKTKKTVFSRTVDTRDIDEIKVNILT